VSYPSASSATLRLQIREVFGIISSPRVPAAMVTSVPMEDRLDGASNFHSWKSRLLITLEESDLMKFVEEVVPEPDDASKKS
jgi:hypothetical protein